MNNPPALTTKRRIQRIAPLQLGKILAILYGGMGLLLLPFFLLVSVMAPSMPADQRVGMMAFGAGFAIFAPIMYAVMGFVVGVIGAALYNLVAKWVGGIEVDIEHLDGIPPNTRMP